MQHDDGSERYTTSQLATLAGYSLQQVRDLERLGVIAPAARQPNGYRRFSAGHLAGLRAYRSLVTAVGPVTARKTMSEMHDLPHEAAIASIIALHVELARSRAALLTALSALDRIIDESAHEAPPSPDDSMSITELSAALGVRSSTLRFWEQQGLIDPDRPDSVAARRYPPAAVADARIVAALRSGGYRIPAVQAIIASLRSRGDGTVARDALQERLRNISVRSEALLLAGAELADLLRRSEADQRPTSSRP